MYFKYFNGANVIGVYRFVKPIFGLSVLIFRLSVAIMGLSVSFCGLSVVIYL